MRPLPLLVSLLALAGAAAGCLQAQDEAPVAAEVQPVVGDLSEDLSREPGRIAGVVRAPTLEPVAGANVTLLQLNRTLRTDARGGFEFRDLPNGRHLLRFEAGGYEGKTVAAQALNGTVYRLNVTLQPVPLIEPYREAQELRGMVACTAVLVAGGAEHRMPCGNLDPNDKRAFELQVYGDARTVVVEQAWDPATPAAARLALAVETVGFGSADVTLAQSEGEGYNRLQVDAAAFAKYYPNGGTIRVLTDLAPGAGDMAGLAFQQPFTLVVTVFYHEAAPDGYAVLTG